MKHLLALMLALCLMLGCTPLTCAETTIEAALPARLLMPEEASPAEQEALETALNLVMLHHPYLSTIPLPTVHHVNAVALTDGTQAIVVSLFFQSDWPLLYAVVTINASNSAVIRYEETDEGWFSQTQEQWESVYGSYGLWPLEMQALYDALYCVEINHATLPDGCITEEEAFELALTAAGLASQRGKLTYERSLALNDFATEGSEQLVWLITLLRDGHEVAQVDLSAYDGHMVDLFMNESDLG